MIKFLLGLLTGVLLIVVLVGIAIFAVLTMRSKPASIANGSTLVLHVTGDVPEKAQALNVAIPFVQERSAATVEEVWRMLQRAAADSRISAVVFEPSGTSLGWAKMEEIRSDLEQFRKSGKPLVAYLRSPGSR